MAKEEVCPWPRGAAVDPRGVCLLVHTSGCVRVVPAPLTVGPQKGTEGGSL